MKDAVIAGVARAEIARQMCCTRLALNQLCQRRGIVEKPRVDQRALVRMVGHNCTVPRMALALGCDESTVRRLCHKLSLKWRPTRRYKSSGFEVLAVRRRTEEIRDVKCELGNPG